MDASGLYAHQELKKLYKDILLGDDSINGKIGWLEENLALTSYKFKSIVKNEETKLKILENAYILAVKAGEIKSEDSWMTLIDTDMPKFGPITDKIFKDPRNYQGVRGDVRIATGNFFTAESYEAYRKKVLKTPLP